MNDEDTHEITHKDLKKKLEEYVSKNQDVENKISPQYDYLAFIRKTVKSNIWDGIRAYKIIDDLNNIPMLDLNQRNNMASFIDNANLGFDQVLDHLSNSNDRLYSATGAVSQSTLNMGSGIAILDSMLNINKANPEVLRIVENNPEDNLYRNFDNLSNKLIKINFVLGDTLKKISVSFAAQDSILDIKNMGNLITEFILEFLNFFAPKKEVLRMKWCNKSNRFYQGIYTIIGNDNQYDPKSQKYSNVKRISQRFTELLNTSDGIKHESLIYDLSKLRYRLEILVRDLINFIQIVLNMRTNFIR